MERRQFIKILDNVHHVKPRFGSTYYRLDIGTTELSALRKKLEDE